MSFVVFDTEYTTWEGCNESGWHGNQKKEIVQIAALKISDNLEVLNTFNVLCKPIVNPVLSDYFVNLTGITNEAVSANGIPFAEAYDKFTDFVGKDICYSHGWGGDLFSKSDGDVIAENIKINHMVKCKYLKYRNIAAIFKELYTRHRIDIKNQSSGQIVKILNIQDKLVSLGLDEHNALFDVYSILEGLKFFKNDSLELLNNNKNL